MAATSSEKKTPTDPKGDMDKGQVAPKAPAVAKDLWDGEEPDLGYGRQIDPRAQ